VKNVKFIKKSESVIGLWLPILVILILFAFLVAESVIMKDIILSNSVVALATAIMASAALVTILVSNRQVQLMARQQRLKAIEDRLEKFYIPLIKAFSSYVYTAQTEDEIETIITCRRYLAGNNLLRVLPMHFKFKADKIAGSANWTFYAKEDFEQWKEALDVLWEEFLEVLKEYYTLSGTEISLPEKPDWLIGYK